MFVHRLYAADADTSGGTGPESTETDSTPTSGLNDDAAQSAAPDAPASTTSSTATPDVDKAKKYAERTLRKQEEARKEVHAAYAAKLAELGIDIGDGEDPLTKIDEIRTRNQASTQTATELERAQAKAATLDQTLQKEKAARQAYVEDSEFRIAVQRHSETVDASMVPDIRASFFATYRIRQTDAGVRVYDKAGSPVETDDGDDMTPDEVFAAFIAARPHFQRAQQRTVAGTTGAPMKGNGTSNKVTKAALGAMSPEQIVALYKQHGGNVEVVE